MDEQVLAMLKQAKENSPQAQHDSNVERVREKLLARSKRGYAKYGVFTDEAKLSFLMWLQHLQEELMDAAVYIEVLLNEDESKPAE